MQRSTVVWLVALGMVMELHRPIFASRLLAAGAKSSSSPASPSSSSSSSASSPAAATDESSSSEGGTSDSSKPQTSKKGAAAYAADADPDYEMALVRYRAGKYSEAAVILRGLTKNEEQKEKAALLIGAIFFQKKKLARAKEYFDKGGDAPLTKETAFAYGATYLDSEDYTKALIGLRANLKMHGPNRTLTRHMVAVCFYKLSQYTRAERYFEATSPKALPKPQRMERQRYLANIRQKQDEILSTFMNDEGESRSQSSLPVEFGGGSQDDSWLNAGEEVERTIRWKPGAFIRQESTQNQNRSNGADTSDLILHRVGVRAYAGGDPYGKSFGSLEFGAGFAGYDVKTAQSRSFQLPNITGEFLSEIKERHSEENTFAVFNPLLNFEFTQTTRGEVGARYTAMIPKFKTSLNWGQSEVFVRIRREGKEFETGLEVSAQQPYDQAQNKLSNDGMIKFDVNQRLGELSLHLNAQTWRTDNVNFKAFDRNRMQLLDSRFKYHNGFEAESKLGVSGNVTVGEIGLRAAYDLTSRQSDELIERLNPVDDIDSVAKVSNKRSFALSIPLWDTVNVIIAGGSQSMSGYVFRRRDPETLEVVKEYTADVKQTFSQLGAQVVLVDAIRVRINFTTGTYDYVGEGVKDRDFEEANPRSSESSVIHFELSKSF